ncbi:hypothetical protein M9Y10_013569 [Tritrichomonas musculus]|uniref:DUF3447 domain-containing protein n=1 Tax=Tritrichomonas musculus TaxID=1915356 RepID=A0ABR2L0B0_9EUKA
MQELLDQFKEIQNNFLDYIDDESNEEDKFQNLKALLDNFQLRNDSQKLKAFLYLILKISNNHHRNSTFFQKIEQLLLDYKNDIMKFYSNSSIFNIFKSNKRLLLFLLNEKMITFDKYIFNVLITPKYYFENYLQYFAPEIKPFLADKSNINEQNKKFFDENISIEEITEELPENFEENRRIGENEDFICRLIQKDSIKDFIVLVNQKNIDLNIPIFESIYETNQFLSKIFGNANILDNKHLHGNKITVSLIEYAAFFGSIQIFNYLKNCDIELTPSLWLYAIHSNSPEMIHKLEELKIEQPEIFLGFRAVPTINSDRSGSIFLCLNESIKCHHNAITNYFLNNILPNDSIILPENLVRFLKYYNFEFFQNDFINQSLFFYYCKYDYVMFVNFLLMNEDIDLNKIQILNKCF